MLDVYGINTGDGLTGKHYNTFAQVNDPVTHVGKDDFYNNDFAGFFEDSWKATSKLTLNLGLRYDVFLIPQPPQPNTLTPLTNLYTSTIHIPKNQFAPRLGAAWEVTPNTVMRIGYGMFYAKTTNTHLLRHARRERRHSADLQLHTGFVPGADVPEPDFHAAGTSARSAFRRSARAAGDPVHAALSDAIHARLGSQLRKPAGA